MRIALAQMKTYKNMQDNLNKSIKLIKEAANHNADMILFPEVQLTEFFPQYKGKDVEKYLIKIDSKEVRQLQEASRKNSIISIPNIYLEENRKPYDASLFIGTNGKIQGIQKMVHVAQAEKFYEQDYYTPSDDGFKVFDTIYGKIGIVVCFDRHYTESIRTEMLMGADLIVIPTVNTKAEPSEMFEWELRVQAFQNSVAIAMCNRVGTEGQMDFSGESIVIDAKGNVVAKAKANNMPNDTIERGIKKAAGNVDAVNYVSCQYEGYGPNGTAIIVEALTDNKNRTASNVRNAFTKGNGNVGTTGCVSYMFDQKGQILVDKEAYETDADEFMMMALDAGAEDFVEEEDSYEILTTPEDFSVVREALEKENVPMVQAEITMIPQNYVELTSDEDKKMFQRIMDLLDEDDDVQNVYHNVEEDDE